MSTETEPFVLCTSFLFFFVFNYHMPSISYLTNTSLLPSRHLLSPSVVSLSPSLSFLSFSFLPRRYKVHLVLSLGAVFATVGGTSEYGTGWCGHHRLYLFLDFFFVILPFITRSARNPPKTAPPMPPISKIMLAYPAVEACR